MESSGNHFATLAAAHNKAGQVDVAIKRIKQALEQPQVFSPAELAALKEHQRIYEAQSPYRQVRAPASEATPKVK